MLEATEAKCGNDCVYYDMLITTENNLDLSPSIQKPKTVVTVTHLGSLELAFGGALGNVALARLLAERGLPAT